MRLFVPQRRRNVDHAVHDQADRVVDEKDQTADGHVVHEVFADAGRIADYRHVNAVQVFRGSDACEKKIERTNLTSNQQQKKQKKNKHTKNNRFAARVENK